MSADALVALGLSIRVAFFATLLNALLGIPLAYILARRAFRGRALVDLLVTLPLVLPPTVTGFYLIVLLGRRGWLGAPCLAKRVSVANGVVSTFSSTTSCSPIFLMSQAGRWCVISARRIVSSAAAIWRWECVPWPLPSIGTAARAHARSGHIAWACCSKAV